MAHDAGLERYLDGVELVQSRGDPERKRLCVMSLVAFLAGENHTDRPESASRVVAAFARSLNDAMDRRTRQRLVAFAPRLRGTADGGDAERHELLHQYLVTTLLPAAARDLRVAAGTGTAGRDAECTVELVDELGAAPAAEHDRLVQDARFDHAALIGPIRAAVASRRSGHLEQHAEAVARILIAAVTGLARPSRRSWYWNEAIALLDQLCETPREQPGRAGAPARSAVSA